MIEWIDWWYQSEEFGRTAVGTLILAVVLGGLGSWVADEAVSDGGELVGILMFLTGFLSFIFLVLSLFGPAALRLVIWVVTGA